MTISQPLSSLTRLVRQPIATRLSISKPSVPFTPTKVNYPSTTVSCLSGNATIHSGQDANAVYIHLPFCAQRCAYCAFTVLVSGRSALPNDSKPSFPLASHVSYIDVLCREIDAFFALRPHVSGTPLRSVYLGGGTPSLLHPSLLDRLFRTLRAHVAVDAEVGEVTCEMDPATFSPAAAAAFVKLGVNRASIGAQSFDDGLLAACRRIHRRDDIYDAVAAVRSAGVRNVSLDLISGLPGQSLGDWSRSVDEALALQPQHISVYDLTLEPDTPFGKRYSPGVAPLPSNSTAADMLTHAARRIQSAGFERYEVSNFAHGSYDTPAASSRSAHNLAYWRNEPFYAFGIGATSLVDHFRFARPTQLRQYEAYVTSLECAVENTARGAAKEEVLFPGVAKQTDTERFEDFVINSMRLLQDGLLMDDIRNNFSHDFVNRFNAAIEKCARLVDDGLVRVIYGKDGSISCVRLTEGGALLENSVVSDLLLESIWRYPP